MSKKQFERLAADNYNRIPVMREVLADLETPLSAYMKLADSPCSYLFESVHGGEKWGRYSIIGLSSTTVFRVQGRKLTLEHEGRIIEERETDDPLQEIENFRLEFRVPEIEGVPRFAGGLVGYFGYDTIQYIEPRLAESHKPDSLNCPDILLMVSDRLIVFDNLSGKLYIIIQANPEFPDAWENACTELDELTGKLATEHIQQPVVAGRSVNEEDFISDFNRDRFERAVDTIKQYIIDGDVMQVVLSQRLSIPFTAPPINLYRALRCLNPSPYMFYMHLGDFHIVGSSPEILVRLEEGVVTVRPIAGTRPRGKNDKQDRKLEQELLADPKELAEHLMLIDLGRNDVGRVAKTGSVTLTDKMIIERYSHVMHIVSNIIGELQDDKSAMDVLRATFPAGTVSGAPKVRAMEIIDELEPVKRGVYAGAVGYLSWDGNMDTAIAIRTAVIRNQALHIQVGAGIVADSVPEREWEETMNKGRAIFRAVSMAENGLVTG
ncbi:MAG TPA: anthranilate synthase component I [Gammaproteobacteria bacterium]|nr:anthranilate synthase component I [Gammaproteobacteria bacterium]